MLRTMTGLWPAAPAEGKETKDAEIVIPESLFVVPQDCYFPNRTSLRSQITYPHQGSKISDAEASNLLVEVGLEDIVSRYSLDEVEDWSNVLSGKHFHVTELFVLYVTF